MLIMGKHSPFTPGGPISPAVPGDPFLPVSPSCPGGPCGPSMPGGPVSPGGPLRPVAPLVPSTPGDPAIPGTPGIPCVVGQYIEKCQTAKAVYTLLYFLFKVHYNLRQEQVCRAQRFRVNASGTLRTQYRWSPRTLGSSRPRHNALWKRENIDICYTLIFYLLRVCVFTLSFTVHYTRTWLS